MKDTDIDNLTKRIMTDSYNKLSDPAFNDIVMRKISQAEKRKITARMAFYFFIVMITSGILIYFALQNLMQKITDMSSNLVNIPGSVWLTTKKIIDLISGNEYFILPLITMLVLKKILDRKFKHRIHML